MRLPLLLLAAALLAAGAAADSGDAPAAVTAAELAELRAGVHEVLAPADKKAFDKAAAASWNLAFHGTTPRLVVRPRSTAELRHALAWVSEHKQAVTVRASGRCSAPWDARADAVLLDLVHLDAVKADPHDADVLLVGGAAPFVKVDAALRGMNPPRVVPAPLDVNVGFGGYALGGGHGVGTRAYGRASDFVVGVELVTANGTVLQCSATENAELFDAVRGAGGANFGVVSQFRVNASMHDVPATWFFQSYALNHSDAVDAFQKLSHNAPRKVMTRLVITEGDVTVMAAVFGDDQSTYYTDRVHGSSPVRVNGSTYLDGVDNLQGNNSAPSFFESRSRYVADAASTAALAEEIAVEVNAAGAANAKVHGSESFVTGQVYAYGGGHVGHTGGAAKHADMFAVAFVATVSTGDKLLAGEVSVVDTTKKAFAAHASAFTPVVLPDPNNDAAASAFYEKDELKLLMKVKKSVDSDYVLGYPGSVPTCSSCNVRGYTPPATVEKANYPALYAIISVAVLATLYLLFVVFRKDAARPGSDAAPLLDGEV